MCPKYLLKIACWALPGLGLCQHNTFYPPDARAAALGGAGVTFSDVHSAFSNQAGLSGVTSMSAIAFAEQKFLIGDIQSAALAVALPTSAGVFGAVIHYFGFQPFNEQKLGIAYARNLLKHLAIGAEISLLHAAISGYGQRTAYTFELGLISVVSRQLRIGFHVSNPLRIAWSENDYLPTLMRLGCHYQPSEKVSLYGEVEKDIGYPVRTIWGLEYSPTAGFQARLGLSTAPLSPRFGVGLQLFKSLRLDIAAAYHQILGFTPSAGFNFQKSKL